MAEEKKTCACCGGRESAEAGQNRPEAGARRTARSEKEQKDLINRLSRIEGQIRGIKGMVEKGSYCPDIMVQVSAANAALNSFNKVLLSNHLHNCVTNDLRDGREDTMDELIDVLQKLMK